jgi:hypothetical protein
MVVAENRARARDGAARAVGAVSCGGLIIAVLAVPRQG